MTSDLNPAIAFLQGKLEEAERKANELRGAINVLRAEAGLAPLAQNGVGGKDASSGATAITSIKDDTFYGKRQQTAIREFLEMRKAAGQGPAKPREIYDALKAGGYEFEAKSDEIALVGLRALLRKRTHVFHKLPNGAYGMTAWYPHAKSAKMAVDGASKAEASDPDIDDDDEIEAAASPEESNDAAAT